jgi:uncharacterized protein (TIGR02145 family)
MKTIFFIINVGCLFNLVYGQVTDINGQTYKTVVIGTQTWMAENLNVSTFRNGDTIPEANTAEDWKTAGENGQPAWCYYENDPANGAKYGKLYNWFAVNDSRGLAPAGYHIPTNEEWTTLEYYLGNDAGNKMKSTSGWPSYIARGSKTCPNCKDWIAEYRKKVPCHTCKDTRTVPAPNKTISGNGTNSSGFSGFPAGFRNIYGSFYFIGYLGYWWSASEYDSYVAWYHLSGRNYGRVDRSEDDRAIGCSVRCLRD